MNYYAQRKIDIKINIADGEMGDLSGEEILLTGLRVSAQMVTYNGEAQGQLHLRIFGMRLDYIDRLTSIGPIMTQRRKNIITVTAGEENDSMATVYEGTINSAFGDFQGAPEVVFNVIALAAAFYAVKPIPAKSYKEPVNIIDVIGYIANDMELKLENNASDVILPNRNYSGTALTQLKQCAIDANINYTIENGVLAIWDKNSYRLGDPIDVSAATGMVGYPLLSADGIACTMLFNHDLRLGGRINVESTLTVSNGIWNIVKISHVIESETPDGQWFTQVICQRGFNG